MNLEYLGDALDHWKGAMFRRLQRDNLLCDFKVGAMATDSEEWRQKDIELYANLLCVEREQIIEPTLLSTVSRRNYFENISSHQGDLFLDPDTGIATGRSSVKHIQPSEVRNILRRGTNRLLVTYQHIRGKKTRSRMQEIEAVLKRAVGQFPCCSYESGTVAMLFCSMDSKRVSDICQHFESLYGQHANHRVHRW